MKKVSWFLLFTEENTGMLDTNSLWCFSILWKTVCVPLPLCVVNAVRELIQAIGSGDFNILLWKCFQVKNVHVPFNWVIYFSVFFCKTAGINLTKHLFFMITVSVILDVHPKQNNKNTQHKKKKRRTQWNKKCKLSDAFKTSVQYTNYHLNTQQSQKNQKHNKYICYAFNNALKAALTTISSFKYTLQSNTILYIRHWGWGGGF